MTFEALRLEQVGHIVEITLIRPDLLNRFDAQLHREFIDALISIRSMTDVRTVLLLAEGRAFSAGGDFEFMRQSQRDPEFRQHTADEGRELLTTLIDVPQPIVVGVQGAAMGLGATVAFSADAIVAAKSAFIADTHVNIGLVAGDGGCLAWPASVGMARARRHLLTGDRLSAEDAFRLGVVTDLVESPEDVEPAARAIAVRIAELPPLAVQGTKRALNAVTKSRAAEVVDLAMSFETDTLASNDLLEAIDAFLEKRPGNYTGR